MRKHVSRRFQALSGGEIAAPMSAMRQVRVGSQELGPWQSFTNSSVTNGWRDLWTHPRHVSKWTKNCFGMSECFAVLFCSRQLLTKLAAASWKHRTLSVVEQEESGPTPQERGAEQGDAAGPLECSLALWMVVAEALLRVGGQNAAGIVPWIGSPTHIRHCSVDTELTDCSKN